MTSTAMNPNSMNTAPAVKRAEGSPAGTAWRAAWPGAGSSFASELSQSMMNAASGAGTEVVTTNSPSTAAMQDGGHQQAKATQASADKEPASGSRTADDTQGMPESEAAAELQALISQLASPVVAVPIASVPVDAVPIKEGAQALTANGASKGLIGGLGDQAAASSALVFGDLATEAIAGGHGHAGSALNAAADHRANWLAHQAAAAGSDSGTRSTSTDEIAIVANNADHGTNAATAKATVVTAAWATAAAETAATASATDPAHHAFAASSASDLPAAHAHEAHLGSPTHSEAPSSSAPLASAAASAAASTTSTAAGVTPATWSAHIAPHLLSPQWQQALGQQMLWVAHQDLQSASLTLNPPELGPVRVILELRDGQASAAFSSLQPEVRQALQDAVPRLKEMFADAGLQLGQTSVNSGDASQGEQHALADDANDSRTGQRRGPDTAADIASSSKDAGTVMRSATATRMVDLFA